MTQEIKIEKEDIVVGEPLPWDVYDSMGLLLAKKGTVIATTVRQQALLARGFRHEIEEEPEVEETPKETTKLVFIRVNDLCEALFQLYEYIEKQDQCVGDKTRELAAQVQTLCEEHSDGVLAAVHLYHEGAYSVLHSIHVAFLCYFVSKKAGLNEQDGISLICAALTCNVSMRELQDYLQNYSEPLTNELRGQVQSHPQRSVSMLEQCGINDETWLTAIGHHHERLDGSGYPEGLDVKAVSKEANLIALADCYTAMLSSRSYRSGIPTKDALRKVFVSRGVAFDEKLCLLLIKELGVYPPGSFVRLQNGEVGVVVKRNADSTKPVVAAFASPRGGAYDRAIMRDSSAGGDLVIKETVLLEKKPPKEIASLWQ